MPIANLGVIDGGPLKTGRPNYWAWLFEQKLQNRMWGIDAPEFSQGQSGLDSKAYVERLVRGQPDMDVKDIDRYRPIVHLVTRKETGDSLNGETMDGGWADYYRTYTRNATGLVEAEVLASHARTRDDGLSYEGPSGT